MTQPEWQTCTNCHQSVPGDAAVCGFCGHRLKAAPAEQPTLVQAVPTPPVVEQPRPLPSPAPVPEPPRGRWPTSRALGVIAAALGMLSPLLPWLTVRFARSHKGFDIDWSDLIPGAPFPGGRPSFRSVGVVVLILGIAALWWVLTERPRWLGLVAGVGTLAIALGVAVQVARTIADDLERFFEIVDIGLYTALIGAILMLLGGLSRRRT